LPYDRFKFGKRGKFTVDFLRRKPNKTRPNGMFVNDLGALATEKRRTKGAPKASQVAALAPQAAAPPPPPKP
jgi:hypothetical protein